MTRKEKESREAIITLLMSELKLSRQESQIHLAELEKFGLVKVQPTGQLYLKVV